MKKIFLSIIFLLFSTQLVFCKEVRTRFGFYINLPNNFTQLNANIEDLLEKDSEDIINKKYFDELMSGSAKSDMNIEYLFPIKKYNPETNNINITMAKQDFREIMAFTIDELCPEMKIMVEGLYNKRVKMYQCMKNSNNIQNNWYVQTWMEAHQQIFTALQVEKNMMFFLLAFVALVAAFSITNTLITLTVQKTHEIGLLKALGFPNHSIIGIFLWMGLIQGIIGTSLGIGLALVILKYRNELLNFS